MLVYSLYNKLMALNILKYAKIKYDIKDYNKIENFVNSEEGTVSLSLTRFIDSNKFKPTHAINNAEFIRIPVYNNKNIKIADITAAITDNNDECIVMLPFTIYPISNDFDIEKLHMENCQICINCDFDYILDIDNKYDKYDVIELIFIYDTDATINDFHVVNLKTRM